MRSIDQFLEFFQTLRRKFAERRIRLTLIMLILLVGLGVSVYVSQQQQDIRNYAREQINQPSSPDSSADFAIGTDSEYGHAITSVLLDGTNVIAPTCGRIFQFAAFDYGRQLPEEDQCTADGSTQDWIWNPTQACGGNSCAPNNPVSSSNDIPLVLWDSNNKKSDLTLDQNIVKVEENLYKITATVSHTDSENHSKLGGQYGAYLIENLKQFVTYDGSSPWKNGAATIRDYPVDRNGNPITDCSVFPVEQFAKESWAAIIDPATGRGLTFIDTSHMGTTSWYFWPNVHCEQVNLLGYPKMFSSIGANQSRSQTLYVYIGDWQTGRQKAYNLVNRGGGDGKGDSGPLTVNIKMKDTGKKYPDKVSVRVFGVKDCSSCEASCDAICSPRMVTYDPSDCAAAGCAQWSKYQSGHGYSIGPCTTCSESGAVNLPSRYRIVSNSCSKAPATWWYPPSGSASCTVLLEDTLKPTKTPTPTPTAGVVQGSIFLDKNKNARRNSIDIPISDVALVLSNKMGSATYNSTSASEPEHNYTFGTVPNARYTIRMPQYPEGFKLIQCSQVNPRVSIPEDNRYFYCIKKGVAALMRWTPNSAQAYIEDTNDLFAVRGNTVNVDFPLVQISATSVQISATPTPY